jgi:hypothetical protein
MYNYFIKHLGISSPILYLIEHEIGFGGGSGDSGGIFRYILIALHNIFYFPRKSTIYDMHTIQ